MTTYLSIKVQGELRFFAGFDHVRMPVFTASRERAWRFKRPFLAERFAERNVRHRVLCRDTRVVSYIGC